jgi:hypothetical protein
VIKVGRRKRVDGIEAESGKEVFTSGAKEVSKSSGNEVFKSALPRRR